MIFLSKLDPIHLELMLVEFVRSLFQSRLFDASRVFGGCFRIVIDGSVREKCRKGFEDGGKENGGGRYRYVLQASVLLFGHPIPLMHEHIDVDDPVAEKEDCEINWDGACLLCGCNRKQKPLHPHAAGLHAVDSLLPRAT